MAAAATRSGLSYLITDPIVGIRVWGRRDRSELATWPAPDVPAHWRAIYPAAEGRRESYAIDAIRPAAPPTLIGRISLRNMTATSAWLGIYLHPAQCGRGYGPAALRVFQHWLKQEGKRQLWLDVAIDNERAIRAYQKVGWSNVGQRDFGGHVYQVMQVKL